MLVVRAITEHDLNDLFELAKQTGYGMTTLKADWQMLEKRVEIACASFAGYIDASASDYLFVMEDTASEKLVGVSAIKAAVGMDEPFYNYRIGTLVHSSKEIDVFSRMDTLYLSNDLTGCAELCSLFLLPEYRHGHNGKMLSKSRFLFLAQFPYLFPEKLIAEMRGFQQEDGSSPFWDSLGRHFFKMDFSRADDLSSMGKKSFIAELMPRHPLYVAYLPEQAQQVIGKVHTATEPARRLLEQEGLYYEGYVDIFDAGPVLQARIGELRTVRDSVLAMAETVTQEVPNDVPLLLISNTDMRNFRVIVEPAHLERKRITLSAQHMEVLACQPGERVRAIPLTPKRKTYV
jgi:arginine N-succinyltransferase